MNKKAQESSLIPQKLVWLAIAIISAIVITVIVMGLIRGLVTT